MPRVLRVGVQGDGYVSQRLLEHIPSPEIQLITTRGPMALANFLNRKVLGHHHATTFTNNYHWDPGLPLRDLYHFVNTIGTTPTPWIVSFEHYVPRWDPRSPFGMRLLASPRCRRLLALSDYARRAQEQLLSSREDIGAAIAAKIEVLHPPQRLLVRSLDEKRLPAGTLRCVFVGRDFFRKGGREVVDAVFRLIGEGRSIELDIVSSLDVGDYATRSSERDRTELVERITGLGSAVRLHGEMANPDVLRLLRDSHVALLPTYDDTYGFSVLEAQASGTPVITTNVCALEEINPDAAGWVVRLARDEWGQAAGINSGGTAEISRAIHLGVYEHLRSILDDPASIRTRAVACLDRIQADHDPERYAARVRTIYTDIVGSASGLTPP